MWPSSKEGIILFTHTCELLCLLKSRKVDPFSKSVLDTLHSDFDKRHTARNEGCDATHRISTKIVVSNNFWYECRVISSFSIVRLSRIVRSAIFKACEMLLPLGLILSNKTCSSFERSTHFAPKSLIRFSVTEVPLVDLQDLSNYLLDNRKRG
jgi:hypothetical protein